MSKYKQSAKALIGDGIIRPLATISTLVFLITFLIIIAWNAELFIFQDLSIYLKRLELDLLGNSSAMPHQKTYLQGFIGHQDLGQKILDNWGTPLSNFTLLPLHYLNPYIQKLLFGCFNVLTPVFLALLFGLGISPSFIFCSIGPLFSCLFWGGMGAVPALYVCIIFLLWNSRLLAVAVAGYIAFKPQFGLPFLAFMCGTALIKRAIDWKALITGLCTLLVLAGISFYLFPNAWPAWMDKDFSVALERHLLWTHGFSGLLSLLGYSDIKSFIPFLSFLSFILCFAIGCSSKHLDNGKSKELALACASLAILTSPYVWVNDWLLTSVCIAKSLNLCAQKLTIASKVIVPLCLIGLEISWLFTINLEMIIYAFAIRLILIFLWISSIILRDNFKQKIYHVALSS